MAFETSLFLEPGRLDQWKHVCLVIISVAEMVAWRSHLTSKQFYVGLCKSSILDDFYMVTSEDQVLRREVLILRASMEVDRHLCLDWMDLR